MVCSASPATRNIDGARPVEPTDTGRSTLFDISIAARSWQRHVTEALDNEAIGRATHDIRELLDRIAAVDAAGPTRSPRPE